MLRSASEPTLFLSDHYLQIYLSLHIHCCVLIFHWRGLEKSTELLFIYGGGTILKISHFHIFFVDSADKNTVFTSGSGAAATCSTRPEEPDFRFVASVCFCQPRRPPPPPRSGRSCRSCSTLIGTQNLSWINTVNVVMAAGLALK